MQTEVIAAIVGVGGIVLGSLVTHLLARKKTDAEVEKIKAETEKAHVEAEKLRAEIIQLTLPNTNLRFEDQKRKINVSKIDGPPDKIVIETSEYKEHPLPGDIVSEIDMLPEYRKEIAVRSYDGLKIKWRLALQSLTIDRDIVSLGLVPIQSSKFLPVLCKVKLSEYPEIKLLRKNDELWVFGTISKVHRPLYGIILSDCLLEFD